MAGTVNDSVLAVTGGPTYNDGLLAYYKAGGAPADAFLPDAEHYWLALRLGLPLSTSTPNADMWMQYLSSYPGTLNDKWLAYWGGLADGLPSNVFNSGGAAALGFSYEAYDPTTIGAVRVNIINYSEQLDNAAWTKTATGTGVAPVVTPNAGTAPDGTLTADRVQLNRGAGNTATDDSRIAQTPATIPAPMVIGNPYTDSVWIKAFDSANVGKVVQYSANGLNPLAVTLTADWQKVSFTFIADVPNRETVLRCRGIQAQPTSADADFLAWGWQRNAGTAPVAYQRITDWTTEYLAMANPAKITMFQDYTGNTPVTGIEQPVGLNLDLMGAYTYGPELVGDPDFDNPSKWNLTQPVAGSVSIAGGILTINTTDGSFAAASPNNPALPAVVGKTYELEVQITSVTTGGLTVEIGGAQAAVNWNTAGTFRAILTATTTAVAAVKRANAGVAANATVTRFSVREIKGRAGLVRGPETTINGGFDNSLTAWAVGPNATGAAIGGWAVITATASTTVTLTQNLQPSVVGKWIEVKASFRNRNGGALAKLTIWNGSADVAFQTSTATSGDLRCIGFVATGVQFSVIALLASATTGNSIEWDNISVRELVGNHALQSTSTSRPILSARKNLFTKTDILTDSTWIKRGTGTVSATTAPDGTGQLVSGLGILGTNDVYQLLSGLGAGSIAPQIAIWPVTVTGTLKIANPQNLGAGEWSVNLALLTPGQWNVITSTHPAVSIVAAFVTSTGGGGIHLGYTSGTASFYAKAAQLEYGSVSTRYQRVNTATDYDFAGFPFYFKFDGVDDSWSIPTLDLTQTAKLTTFVGMTKFSDAAQGVVAELSASAAANNGAYALYAPHSAAASAYMFRSRGTASSDVVASPYAAPHTAVITGIGDIAASLSRIRVNSTVFSDVVSQGTGNYGTYPLYIGRRAGSSLPEVMNLNHMTCSGAVASAAQITATEKYISNKMGLST